MPAVRENRKLRQGPRRGGCRLEEELPLTEFERGWTAALLAAQAWHEAKAKQILVQAKRTRFPKTLEHQAETHRHAAEVMPTLMPEGD